MCKNAKYHKRTTLVRDRVYMTAMFRATMMGVDKTDREDLFVQDEGISRDHGGNGILDA